MPPSPIPPASDLTAYGAAVSLAQPGMKPPLVGPPLVGPPPAAKAPVSSAAAPAPAVSHGTPANDAAASDVSDASKLRRCWRQASSCLSSLVVHAMIILLLGWVASRVQPDGRSSTTLVASLSDSADSLQPLETTIDAEQPADDPLSEPTDTMRQMHEELAKSMAKQASTAASTAPPPPIDSVLSIHGDVTAPVGAIEGELSTGFDADVTGALGGRAAGERAALLAEGGGNKESEDAISRGLRWLQAHQLGDGSWDLRLNCGHCGNPGGKESRTAATGLALLAFLGRGNTHVEGEYQDAVKRGLYYLTTNMRRTSDGGDLRDDGEMYAQGIATIALCEAYGMTHDRGLESFAQEAVYFVLYAQHKGGGWRYKPGEPGDATVSGWQIMALKSAQMAYLRVPHEAIERASHFLDTLQYDKGSRYSYQPRHKMGRDVTTSAIGLLCRMYTGWPQDHPGLERGIEHLAHEGPSLLGPNADIYYDYYATQVMHQSGGEAWDQWNEQMREFLIRTQATQGHESGSWYFGGGRGDVGGRLFGTTMAIMTLEVYYRHLPIYRAEAVTRP
jgi:hypothetical protein